MKNLTLKITFLFDFQKNLKFATLFIPLAYSLWIIRWTHQFKARTRQCVSNTLSLQNKCICARFPSESEVLMFADQCQEAQSITRTYATEFDTIHFQSAEWTNGKLKIETVQDKANEKWLEPPTHTGQSAGQWPSTQQPFLNLWHLHVPRYWRFFIFSSLKSFLNFWTQNYSK